MELYDREAYDAFVQLAAEPDAAFEAYEREQERVARMQDMMLERRRRHRERERERERLLDEAGRLDLE
ncbi:MAG: hypothetical protein SVU32_08550 [Candidatus Nanohaloarchaea archaeon]|nr:hypothetical protein [Candidatus Nanohaloarchaea archaeon]